MRWRVVRVGCDWSRSTLMRWVRGGIDNFRGCNPPSRGVEDEGASPNYRFRTGGVQDLILDLVFSSAFPRLFLPVPSLPAPQNESTDDICAPGGRRVQSELGIPYCRKGWTLGRQLTNVMGRSPVSSIIFLRLLCWVNLCQSTTSIYS